MNEDENLKIIGVVHAPRPYHSAPPVKYPCLVAVSHAHSLYLSNSLAVPVKAVQNGIDIEMFPFQKEKGDRYLSLQRCLPEKGIHEFIELIKRTRSKGDVAGQDTGPLIPNVGYVERCRDAADGFFVRFFGSISHERKVKLLQNAKALVCLPLTPYLEVWSLSCTEALACGTGVIALKNGGLVEQIENGKSGFLCENLSEVEQLIKEDAVASIKPEDCRARSELFTYQKMSARYLELCEQVVNQNLEW